MIKRALRSISAATLRPAAGVIVSLGSVFFARLPGMPIFYFFLTPQNTASVLTIHVLRKIQVTTGRRVIVITAWAFWPWDTAKDPFFRSFIKGLAPRVHYIWIPIWLQRLALKRVNLLARLILRHEDLYRPASLRSTIRYGTSSTMLHADILNHGSREVLYIPKSHENIMEARLEALGVPKDGWFVCAHAREHGWLRDMNAYESKLPAGYRHEQEDHRNVDIEDYFLAFDHIRSMGGTVVRVGDPSMKPVTGMSGVIDYPFTEQWSMLMDLYLVSKCRFVLGCQSGFASFPVAFDTPVLITNFTAIANTARFPYSNNIFLFMQMLEHESGKRLDMEHIYDPRLSTMSNSFQFDALGYRCQTNTPEDILEATKEMLNLIENDSFNHPRSTEQELFHQKRLDTLDRISSPEQRLGNDKYITLRSSESRISAAFAARYLSAGQSQTIGIQD